MDTGGIGHTTPNNPQLVACYSNKGFRDLVPVCKIHGCYQYTQKFRTTFHFNPSDTANTTPLQCVDVNNPLEKVFKRVYTVYTYSNCMINQLLNC